MYRVKLLFCLAMLSIGCSGRCILTVPDHVGPAGGEVPVIVRLKRSEIHKFALCVKNAPLEFRVGSGPKRAAYTDNAGYAGVMLPLPDGAGRHRLLVTYQDREGDVLRREAAVYAWDAERPVVAVDFDCLPAPGSEHAEAAWSALKVVGRTANILYFTQRPAAEHAQVHAEMKQAGYPDGPVLCWQRERWRIERVGRFKLPEIVVEPRLVCQLADARKAFPRFELGVCATELAAKTFSESGLRVVVVGQSGLELAGVTYRKTWTEVAAEGG